METLLVLVGLLALMVACVVIGERLGLPYPILMLLVALAITFIPGFPLVRLDPELIIPIFLPPLLFATAQKTSWAVFQARWKTLLLLAVILTAATAFAVAGLAYWLVPGITFPAALLLGAMVAPPDPVAVDAVSKPAKMPRKLLTTLQTEGLFNDAMAIVLFTAALSAAMDDTTKISMSVIWQFFLGAILATVIGFGVGFIYRIGEHIVTTRESFVAISFVAPFAAFLIAEEFHASGVIAVVVTALETNRQLTVNQGEVRIARDAFWGVTNVAVTGLAFGLMGVQMHNIFVEEGFSVFRYTIPVAAIVAATIILRFLFMLIITFVVEPTAPGTRFRSAILLTWCGMRGVATLALALSVPYTTNSVTPVPERPFILIAATTLLIITLVPTGLTLPGTTRLLNLREDPKEFKREVEKLVDRVQTAAWTAARQKFPGKELTIGMRSAVRNRFTTLRRELNLEIPEVLNAGTGAIRSGDVDVDHEEQLEMDDHSPFTHYTNVLLRVITDAARAEAIKARNTMSDDPEIADMVLRRLDIRAMATPKMEQLREEQKRLMRAANAKAEQERMLARRAAQHKARELENEIVAD